MKLKTCKIGTKLVFKNGVIRNWCIDGKTGTIIYTDDISKQVSK